jgi:N-acyl-D-amino-acid deacylase
LNRTIASVSGLFVFLLASCHPEPAPPPVTVIVNATVLDGTGGPPRKAAVRIEGDKITAVGEIETSPDDLVMDASGLVLAPGFIDTHSHADSEIFELRDALAAVSQGITTVVVGQDGGGPYPLTDFFRQFEQSPAAVNLASYAPHGTLREQVMGEDFRRPATEEEVERMRELLQREMEAGALGLGAGLEYDPGIYSETEEVLALAREAASWGGRYISHVRSEDRYFWEAIDEIIRIGREAGLPVQVSHIKLAMQSSWRQTDRLLGMLDEARASGVDVTADIYPYTYWESTLTVLFPERDFEDREAATFAISEVSTPEGMLIPEYRPEPSYEGKTLAEIAELRGSDPVTTLIDLIRDAEAFREETGEEEVESVIATGMDEADVERLLAWPHTNIGTDGSLDGSHPRGFGAFPRVLGRYVRERQIMRLEDAIRKMTSLSAAHVGISDRGLVRPGMLADLVLFDPATVGDRATPEDPQAGSVGIERVWVNGEVVYREGGTTGRYPGKVIRREAPASRGAS